MTTELSQSRGRAEVLDAWLEGAALLAPAALPPLVQEALRIAIVEAKATREVTYAIDRVIAAIDTILHAVLDDVLHHPDFQRLESAWRGLAYVVEHVAFHENAKVVVWSWTKDDLERDFEDATELTKTRTFAEVYTAEYGTFGGEPYGAILADMEFGPDPRDVSLLRKIAAVAAMAHAPFFAAASPRLLQLTSWRELPSVTEVRGVFEAPRFSAWNALRDRPDARYVGLLLPRCLIRRPYDPLEAETPHGYAEKIESDGSGLLWGSPIFPLAVRLGAIFVRHGTLSALVGDDDLSPDGPAATEFAALGARFRRPPVEVVVTRRLEGMLREVGLIALNHRKGTRRLWVASANSLQAPREHGHTEEGREATLNYLLGTRFPYLFLACRIAHYLKVIERDMLGAARTPLEVERELDAWLSELVNTMDAMSAEDRARYPLRQAQVSVTAEEGTAGWLRAQVEIQPQLRYLGSLFTLTLSTRLDRRGE